jgi:hypothetical protein
MNNLLQLLAALLPEAEQIASIFIHNPKSQHKFSMIISTVDALTPVVAALATAAAAAPAATPAAAPVEEPFIPAGVPSAHN